MMYKLNKRLLTGIVKCLVPSNRMDIRCCHSINGPSSKQTPCNIVHSIRIRVVVTRNKSSQSP